MRSLLRSRFANAILPRLMGGYLKFALRTTRWTLDGTEHLVPHAHGNALILACWHECLPFIPALTWLARRIPNYRPVAMHALVSRHFDGRFIGQVLERFGVTPVHGSSSRGGAAAMRTLLRLLARGCVVSLTPDGPRGPRRQAEPGVAMLAAVSGAPILPCAAHTVPWAALNTWDRMAVPLPFSRGVIVFGPAVTVPRNGHAEALPGITAALNQAAERAVRLCRS